MTEQGLNLSKGERVNLTKDNPTLSKLIIGGGWDLNKEKSGKSFDLDLSAYLVDAAGKLNGLGNVVYFGAKKHSSGSVELDKDNLTGEGLGDDEKIFIDLAKIPPAINEVNFAINIYQAAEKAQNFGMVDNAFIRVVNAADNAQLIKYNLSEDYSTCTGVLAGAIYRADGGWKFKAIGEKVSGSINDIAKKFQ